MPWITMNGQHVLIGKDESGGQHTSDHGKSIQHPNAAASTEFVNKDLADAIRHVANSPQEQAAARALHSGFSANDLQNYGGSRYSTVGHGGSGLSKNELRDYEA